MADFNATLNPANPPDYTRVSQGFRDDSLGSLFSNISEGFEMGIKAGDAFIQRRLDETARSMVEPLRDAAIADVAGYQGSAISYTDPQTGTTDAVPVGEQPQLPPEARAQMDRLGMVRQGVRAGRLSDSYYRSQLDVVSKKLRRMYPGYEDQIDNRLQELTGSIPANKLLADLQAEASASAYAGSKEQTKAMSLWMDGVKQGYIDPSKHPFESFGGDLNAVARMYYPAANADLTLKRNKAQTEYDLSQGKLDTELTTKRLNNSFSTITTGLLTDTNNQLGKNLAEWNKKIRSLDQTKPWTPDEEVQLAALQNQTKMLLRQKLQAYAADPINDKGVTYAGIMSQDAVNKAIEAQMAAVDDYFGNLLNKNTNGLMHNAAMSEAYKQGDMAYVLFNDRYMRRAGTLQTILGTQGFASWASEGNNSAIFAQSGLDDLNYKEKLTKDDIALGIMTGEYGSMKEAQEKAKNPETSPKEMARASKAAVIELRSSIGNEKLPMELRARAAMSLYGANNKTFLKDPRNRDVYNLMADPNTLKSVKELSDKTGNKAIWASAMNWVLGTGLTMTRNFAVQLRNVPTPTGNSITFDPVTHSFEYTNPSRLNVLPGGEMVYTDDHAMIGIKDNLNALIHTMLPVFKLDNPKTTDADLNKWIGSITNAFGAKLDIPLFKAFDVPVTQANGGETAPMFSVDENGVATPEFQRDPATGALGTRPTPGGTIMHLGMNTESGSAPRTPPANQAVSGEDRASMMSELKELTSAMETTTDPELKQEFKDQIRSLNKQLYNSPTGTEPGVEQSDKSLLDVLTSVPSLADAIKSGDPAAIGKAVLEAGATILPFPGSKVAAKGATKTIAEGGARILEAGDVELKRVIRDMDKIVNGSTDDLIKRANEIDDMLFDPKLDKAAKARLNAEFSNIRKQLQTRGVIPSHLMAPADAKSISEAEKMEGKGFMSWFTGASKKEIFQKTGLVKGDDGKWRSFIDDRGVKWRTKSLPNDITLGKTYKLGDLIKHSGLFKAFPEAKDIPVVFDNADGYGSGNYIDSSAYFEHSPDRNDHSKDNIHVGLLANEAPGKFLGTLLHEVQHWMQRNGDFFGGDYWAPYGKTITDMKEGEAVDVAKTFAEGKAIPDDVLKKLGIELKDFKATPVKEEVQDEEATTSNEGIPLPVRNPRRKRK